MRELPLIDLLVFDQNFLRIEWFHFRKLHHCSFFGRLSMRLQFFASLFSAERSARIIKREDTNPQMDISTVRYCLCPARLDNRQWGLGPGWLHLFQQRHDKSYCHENLCWNHRRYAVRTIDSFSQAGADFWNEKGIWAKHQNNLIEYISAFWFDYNLSFIELPLSDARFGIRRSHDRVSFVKIGVNSGYGTVVIRHTDFRRVPVAYAGLRVYLLEIEE
jgi:hypothetical protein